MSSQLYRVVIPFLKVKVSVSENEKELIISGEKFKYTISKKTGEFISLQFEGTEYLAGGPAFNVWRAPLANDVDPWGSEKFKNKHFTPGFGRSIDNQFRTLGMRDLIVQVDETSVIKKSDGRIEIRMKVFSNSTLPASQTMKSDYNFPAFERNETWTFLADGTIELEQEDYPPIRVWGTVGFIIALWVVSLLKLETSSGQFYVASASSLLLGLYAFTLPKCPPLGSGHKKNLVESLGLNAFALFKNYKMAMFFIFALLLGASLQLTNAYGDTFLHDFANIPTFKDLIAVKYPAIIMSISQISETLFILR